MTSTPFMDSTGIWNFPKLKGSPNYKKWRSNIQEALEFSGFWTVVVHPRPQAIEKVYVVDKEGKHVLKDGNKQCTNTTKVEEQKERIHTWNELNKQAAVLIRWKCESAPKSLVEKHAVAKEQWEVLHDHYEDSGFTSRHTALQDLMVTTLVDHNGSISEYVAAIREKQDELKRMGAELPDWVFVSILLSNLDSKYRHFVHSAISLSSTTPVFDTAVTRLHEEERLINREATQALSARAKRGNIYGKKGSKGKGLATSVDIDSGDEDGTPPNCKRCPPYRDGKPKRHWPKNCFTLHPEKREAYMKRKAAQANRATKDDSDDDDDQISIMSFMSICETALTVVTEPLQYLDDFWTSDPATSHDFMDLTDWPLESWGVNELDPWEIPPPSPKFARTPGTEIAGTSPFPPEIVDLAEHQLETSGIWKAGECASQEILPTPPNFAYKRSTSNVEGSTALPQNVDLNQKVELSQHTSLLVYSYTATHQKGGSLYKSTDWIMDSGCTRHMYHDQAIFKDWTSQRSPVIIANGATIYSTGVGTVELELILPNGLFNQVSIKKVLCVPDLSCGLFSISQATDKGLHIGFIGDSCQIIKDKQVVGTASKYTNYTLSVLHSTKDVSTGVNTALAAMAAKDNYHPEAVEVWHRRMGHLNDDDLKRLMKMSKGMNLNSRPRLQKICEPCVRGKHVRKQGRLDEEKATKKLAKIHMDTGGPLPLGFNKHAYWILITDEATAYTWSFTCEHKDDIIVLFKQWKLVAEENSGCKIQAVRIDNGTEFLNKHMKDLVKDQPITIEPSVTYTPEQNGLAEVQNRILMNGVRSMLFDAKLSMGLWPEMIQSKIYLKNRSPTTRLSKTPYEGWNGSLPDLNNIHIIGCIVWCHIPKELRKKLDAKSKKCFLVGYDGNKIYRVWNPATRKVERESHVIFDESNLINKPTTEDNNWLQTLLDGSYDTNDAPTGGPDVTETPHVAVDPIGLGGVLPILSSPPEFSNDMGEINSVGDESEADEAPVDEVLPMAPEIHPDPSTDSTHTSLPPRTRKPSQKALESDQYNNGSWARSVLDFTKCSKTIDAEYLYCRLATAMHPDDKNDFDPDIVADAITSLNRHLVALMATNTDDCEPLTYEQAMSGPDAPKWKAAMNKEITSFIKTGTWKLIQKPKGAAVLSGKWVYKKKYKLDGSVLYKARWVIRGFEQQLGVNFDETFASVVKCSTFKTLFSLVAFHDLDCEQMDVITAFLNSTLNETIYVEQPTGYVNKDIPKFICLLLRALYGLKQAPRAWYYTIRSYLESLGFKHTEADHALFINRVTKIIISLYVDDINIIGPKGSPHIHTLKRDLSRQYQMTDLGPTSQYLGMEIVRDRAKKILTIKQKAYITKILTRFGMASCAPVATPMVQGVKLRKEKIHIALPDDKLLFQSMVGCLMYATLETRPDIGYAVSTLSRFNQNPNQEHIKAAKRVLRYLKGTIDYGITYGEGEKLVGYTDADWAGDKETRRSTGAYIYMLYGGAISWSSKLQLTVALSSCEAEYMAQTQAAKEAIWIARLLNELDLGFNLPGKPVLIQADNQGAIALAKDPRYHSRTKHIDIQWHFVRDQVESGEVEFHWVPTNQMAADGLTKPLTKDGHSLFRKMMGMSRVGP